MGGFPDCTDHLILGTPDVAASISRISREWGVMPAVGGQHLGEGTRNALLSLGRGIYLEILGPDPDQPPPPPDRPRWLGIDDLTEERLVAWAARVPDGTGLADFARVAAAAGVDLGGVSHGSRRRADGRVLDWSLTDVRQDRLGGVLPFFLDWGASPHPSESAPGGVELVSLRARHPDPEMVAGRLSSLGVLLDVAEGESPRLEAELATPAGPVELR